MTKFKDSSAPPSLEPSATDHSASQRPPRSLPEKVTFGVAALILATVAALVGSVWLNPHHQSPPDLMLNQPEPMRTVGDRFYVPFEVKNQGGETAESVQVVAELTVNGKVVESGEQQIDFLSGGETESGAFVFSQNPQQGTLQIRVGSYKSP